MNGSPRRVGAGAPLAYLVTKLATYGWGELRGRDLAAVRSVLLHLGLMLDGGSGTGTATVEQVAAKAGVSVGWTRTRLQILEELGLLEWRRGGIDRGVPVPSWFRVDKTYLAQLVNIAQDVRQADLADLRAAFAARLATLRKKTQWFRGHKRRSVHARLNDALPLTGTVPRPRGGPVPAETPGPRTPTTYARGVAAARAALAAARPPQT